MKTLKKRFNQFKKRNPDGTSWVWFAEAIKDQRFVKRTIREWFNVLVEKNDYAEEDKKELINFLYLLSKGAEENQNKGIISNLRALKPESIDIC